MAAAAAELMPGAMPDETSNGSRRVPDFTPTDKPDLLFGGLVDAWKSSTKMLDNVVQQSARSGKAVFDGTVRLADGAIKAVVPMADKETNKVDEVEKVEKVEKEQQAATSVQAAFRGKKARDSVQEGKAREARLGDANARGIGKFMTIFAILIVAIAVVMHAWPESVKAVQAHANEAATRANIALSEARKVAKDALAALNTQPAPLSKGRTAKARGIR